MKNKKHRKNNIKVEKIPTNSEIMSWWGLFVQKTDFCPINRQFPENKKI